MTFRRRLSSKQREELYNSEVARALETGKNHPECNLCPHPILPGQQWDASHHPLKPRWLSGEPASAIAHRRCNRIWNNEHDTPAFARSERVRKSFLDLKRSRTPMQGGRDDSIKKTMRGDVVVRATGLPQYPRSTR